jgi:RNA polymerase sigma factor (sigma-70 family)
LNCNLNCLLHENEYVSNSSSKQSCGVSISAPLYLVSAQANFGEAVLTDSDWRTLMVVAQSGNAGVYRRLLTEVSAWLYRYYVKRLPSAMVDDAVQEVLLALHEKRHTYDPSKPFGPWLAAIARYKWVDRLRSIKAASMEELSDNLAVMDHGEAVQSARSLEMLLNRLKPAQAEAIRLVKLQGLSIEEAATQTGQTIALVKVNIHRGLGRLTSLVQDQTDDL